MLTVEMRSLVAAVRVMMRGGLARYAVGSGSEVNRLEEELSRAAGVKRALAVNSGTSGLICALVGAGIGPGDEVLVPAYTWVASAAAALAVGAVPVLVEVDQSLTIDPVDMRKKITEYTRAIIPVHMLNLVSDMEAIMAIASEHRLIVVEDACQAIGVTWRGRQMGSIGHVGVYSFQQNKTIQSGEGGALLTNDDRIYARARMYHDEGSFIREERFVSDEPYFVGVNYRMPELTGAILRPQLRSLDKKIRMMRERRAYVLDRLSKGARFRPKVCPHHDESSAVGLAVHFDDPEEARAFATVPGINRLIDTGRHVYKNWESILGKRPVHPKMDPYAWAHRPIEIKPDSCPRTLEILERSCRINLLPDLPTPAYKLAVQRMVR